MVPKNIKEIHGLAVIKVSRLPPSGRNVTDLTDCDMLVLLLLHTMETFFTSFLK